MTIYIVLAIILSVFSLLKDRKWILFLSALLLLIVGGFRAESVGTDTLNYKNLFDWYGDALFNSLHATEPGYVLLQLFVVRNGLTYNALIFIVQFVSIFLLTLYAKKISHRPQYVLLCYVLLYYYLYSLNTTRQYLAAPCLLLSFYELDKGSIKKFVLLVVSAMMFHTSAFVGFFALLFYKKRLTMRVQTILLLLTFIIGITAIPQTIALSLMSFVPSVFIEYILDTGEYRELGFSLSRLLLTIFSVVLVVMLRNDSNKLSLLTFGICILNLFAFQPVIARMAQFFTIIQIALIPEIPYLLKQKYKSLKVPIMLIAYVYMIMVFIYLLHSNVGEVVPYTFGDLKFLTCL